MRNEYASIADIKTANTPLGHSWFDEQSSRYHGSVIETEVISARYFVESSYAVPGDATSGRVYRAVVAAAADGDVRYLGSAGDSCATLDEAIEHIRAVADRR